MTAAHANIQALGHKFFTASMQGNIEVVQDLLGAHPDLLNAVDEHGETALMASAYEGHTAVVTTLIHSRADVDRVDGRFGNTALIWAACRGHSDVVRVLVGEGRCNPNLRSVTGHTALMEAEAGGMFAVIEALLTHSSLPVCVALRNTDGLRLGELFLEPDGKVPSKPYEETQTAVLRALNTRKSQARLEKLAFVMGLHPRAGQSSVIRNWSRNSMFERGLLQQIFSFAVPAVPPDWDTSSFSSSLCQQFDPTASDGQTTEGGDQSEDPSEGDEGDVDEEQPLGAPLSRKTPFRFEPTDHSEGFAPKRLRNE